MAPRRHIMNGRQRDKLATLIRKIGLLINQTTTDYYVQAQLRAIREELIGLKRGVDHDGSRNTRPTESAEVVQPK